LMRERQKGWIFHSNGCIGGMATTRQGGYRIAVLAFYWGRRCGGLARKLRQEDHTIPISSSRAYMRGPCRWLSLHPAHKRQ
jgi:hypothetical protein